jgi:hypothetical protein
MIQLPLKIYKKQKIKNSPQDNKININKFIEELNEDIYINNLTRPFSINLKQLDLNKNYNSAFDEKKEQFLILLVKVQIFCGAEPFSQPRMLKWRGTSSDQNPLFNKRIYFDLKYKNLPLFSSILFKVKHLKYNKNYELMSHTTIAWTNFRLFDHNRRLKTGKINYLSRACIKLVYGKQIFLMILTIVG